MQGFIKDTKGNPMKNATISIKGISKLYEVTKTSAHYKIMLPAGRYLMETNCHGYKAISNDLLIKENEILNLNITLEFNTGQTSISEDELSELISADFKNNNSFTGIEGEY